MRGGGAVPTYLDVDEEITTIQYPGGGGKKIGVGIGKTTRSIDGRVLA